MKKIILLAIFLCTGVATFGQDVEIPDANFKNALLSNPDINMVDDGEISEEEAAKVIQLNVSNLGITDLTGIEAFINLENLSCRANKLTSLDITQNIKLTNLVCNRNKLETLNVTQNINLTKLNCESNDLVGLDVTSNENLTELFCGFNELSEIDVSANRSLIEFSCDFNKIEFLDVTQNVNLINLSFSFNKIRSIDVKEMTNLKNLNCSENDIRNLNVRENLNLEKLRYTGNQSDKLDVTANINLKELSCDINSIKELDVTQNLMLTELDCGFNLLGELDVSSNPMLTKLFCNNNGLEQIDVTANIDLTEFWCNANDLKILDVTQNINLTELRCNENNLETLDVRNCKLSSVVFGSNPNLSSAFLTGQPFETITNDPFNNGLLRVSFQSSPNLNFICIDQEFVERIKERFDDFNYTPTNVSDRCDENFYTISGTVTYDFDNDGCDTIEDYGFPNFKFGIANDTTDPVDLFANDQGVYNAVVYTGDYFLTPIFEIPEYFNIDPAPTDPPTSFTLPEDGPNIVQDFCVTANGDHDDLEIILAPISRLQRPGFTTSYKITYKNKATTTQSGTIVLDYLQNILTLATSDPAVNTTVSDQLIWDFTDLRPLEKREIRFTLTINTTTDTPPVNNEDILNYTATIIGAVDEFPEDNVSTLQQTVVNSYDPNDKTSLEGNSIRPDQVGGFLRYMIRFENTGTASAVNVVVEDEIDITKLDISSLVPLDASHDYVAEVVDGNLLKFSFNDINLPTDDANNDGYVIFKIKTNEDLVLGDQIENKAAIFFDFNNPIITNTSTVSVEEKTLSVTPEAAITDFKIYPNPSTTYFNISFPEKQTKISVSIIDILGKTVQKQIFENTNNEKITHQLPIGMYWVKLENDSAQIYSKLIIE